MRDFKDLIVWERSHRLTLALYRVTDTFPKHEVFGLSSQIRRAGVSVPTNLAEGCGRSGEPLNSEELVMSRSAFGSACEVEYQLLLARDLGFLGRVKRMTSLRKDVEVKRMLSALLQANSSQVHVVQMEYCRIQTALMEHGPAVKTAAADLWRRAKRERRTTAGFRHSAKPC